MARRNVQEHAERYAELYRQKKALDEEMKVLSADLKKGLKTGEKIETDNGVVSIQLAQNIIADDELLEDLRGINGAMKKTTKRQVVIPKLRALAETDERVAEVLRFTEVKKLTVK